MPRSPVFLRLWIAIISVAVLAMPVSGAHLHLCLDGNEPAATMHSTDDGVHHEEGGASPVHRDVDVSVTSSALAKKLDGSFDLSGLVAVAFIVLRIPVERAVTAFPESTTPILIRSIAELRPPLRGPPV